MRLTNAHVRHYRSVSDVNVDLHPAVTVLVGPNASGKSNFVDALRFLRDAARDGLDHAIVARGGIARIRQNSSGRPYNLGLTIGTLQRFDQDIEFPGAYAMEIGSTSGGNFRVEREEASCYQEEVFSNSHPDSWEKEFGYVLEGFSRDKSGKIIQKNSVPARTYSLDEHDRLALGTLIGDYAFHGLAEPLESYIRSWKFSALYPNTLRQLTTPDAEAELREDGSNWASVIRAAKRSHKGKQMLDRIYEMMRVVLPDFIDVSVTTAGSYLVPNFRFESKDKTSRQFDPVQLSDGTLRIFGILLSLYQTPAPSLIVIEEPEQTVHPAVLSMLAEAFKEVAELTQIIVTTHSPQLIEHFEPGNIRIVTMQDGATRIAPIKASQREAVQRGLMTLGEFMAAEGLQPEESR
ncbi:AAA family ATPase [Paracidovorax konjaci]|uniref:Predicted ATPase n=1 Tax=Paracidovorax konjaci TaxID=32040 RepID=A0A1I1WLH6_9BURK|nr:ATP-binding protein [Paracidovorax konjaci]SFD96025.1 Predicted ATPase [Paracidovorax konjaci]